MKSVIDDLLAKQQEEMLAIFKMCPHIDPDMIAKHNELAFNLMKKGGQVFKAKYDLHMKQVNEFKRFLGESVDINLSPEVIGMLSS